MVWALLLASAIVCGQATLPISQKTVTVGGLQLDDIQTATIFYPSDSSTKYPLLSFSHDENQGGQKVDSNYKDLLETVAAAGYVVIAEHSGEGYIKQMSCYDESRPMLCYSAIQADQLRALKYVNETQQFAERVDWGAKTGIYGHGIGADATGSNAMSYVADPYNIGAAVVLQACETNSDWLSEIPTFFGAGGLGQFPSPPFSDADGCGVYGTKGKYQRTDYGPKVFFRMTDARYTECMSEEAGEAMPHGWTHHAIRWFDCHLKNSKADCDHAYNICTDCKQAYPAGPECDSVKSAAGIECMVDNSSSRELIV